MGLKNVTYNAGFISLDNVCYFPPYGDDTMVFCAELPITSAEYVNAGMLDIRATLSLAVNTESDIPEEITVKYEDKVYAIYRRYLMGSGMTQLYLTEKAGVS